MDAGSTTVKGVVLNDDGELLYSKYLPSKGNPVEIIKGFLEEVYAINPEINIVSSAVTGYGEEIIKNAFDVDYGIVETIAHFTAAKYFMPDVEFIIDIGGQDIKCFKFTTAQSTTSSLTRLVLPDAAVSCRHSQTLSVTKLPTLQSSDFLQSALLTSVRDVRYL